jgi:hypothetical protein
VLAKSAWTRAQCQPGAGVFLLSRSRPCSERKPEAADKLLTAHVRAQGVQAQIEANEWSRQRAFGISFFKFMMEPIAPLFLQNVFHASENKESLGSIYADLLALTCSISDDPAKAAPIKKMKADISLINCPMLCLTDSTDYPAEVHQQTREAVTAIPNTTVRNFTSADRTEGDRKLDNFSLKDRVMFDWLDEIFGYQG